MWAEPWPSCGLFASSKQFDIKEVIPYFRYYEKNGLQGH